MLTTTLRLLHAHNACIDRYRYLCKALGGINKYGKDTPITLVKILETNGLNDCVWALQAVHPEQEQERDKIARTFACGCVRKTPICDGRTVWDLLTDDRSRNAVIVAENFVLGKASRDDLAAARNAAASAAAALAAASAAAWDAAWDAAWATAARDAAWDAAWDAAASAAAASAAAWDAARNAAASAAAASAAAASAAAWAAARDAAARDAAARDAALAAARNAAARDAAARDAALAAQENILREILSEPMPDSPSPACGEE